MNICVFLKISCLWLDHNLDCLQIQTLYIYLIQKKKKRKIKNKIYTSHINRFVVRCRGYYGHIKNIYTYKYKYTFCLIQYSHTVECINICYNHYNNITNTHHTCLLNLD